MIQITAFFAKCASYALILLMLAGAAFGVGVQEISIPAPPEAADASAEGPTYDESFTRLLETPIFKDFQAYYDAERSVPIPGIPYTVVRTADGGLSLCDAMTPQGVCFAGAQDEYMLISAYCNDEAFEKSACHRAGDTKHESVLYVMNAADGALLTTVTLDNYSDYAKAHKTGAPPHAGGVAYDGERIWIAKTNAVYAVAFSDVQALIDAGAPNGRVSYLAAKETCRNPDGSRNDDYSAATATTAFRLNTRASYLTFSNGDLLVGEYQTNTDAKLTAYQIQFADDEVVFTERYSVPVPKRAQGAAIYNADDGAYLLISKSAGRVFPSELLVYQLTLGEDGAAASAKLCRSLQYPSMSEDLAISGDTLYTCYESTANVYYAWNRPLRRATFPTDRVTATALSGILR